MVMETSLKILCLGDFMPGHTTLDLIRKMKSNESIIENFLPFNNEYDLKILNLEAPLTNSINQTKKFGINLKIDPHTVEFLRIAEIDPIVCANNHIGDFKSGVLDTIEVLKKNSLNYIGIGKNLIEAKKAYIRKINGISIGILSIAENEFGMAALDKPGAASLILDSDIQQITNLKNETDIILIYYHGGNEGCPIPNPGTKRILRSFVDAGADVVIASHPHVPQGYEVYKNNYIVYSLGNYLFDNPFKDDFHNWNSNLGFNLWYTSYALEISFINKKVRINFLPFHYNPVLHRIENLKEKRRDLFINYIRNLSELINNEGYEYLWNAWCLINGAKYEKLLLKTLIYNGLNKSHYLLKNLWSCESHIEMMRNYYYLKANKIKVGEEYFKYLKGLQKGVC